MVCRSVVALRVANGRGHKSHQKDGPTLFRKSVQVFVSSLLTQLPRAAVPFPMLRYAANTASASATIQEKNLVNAPGFEPGSSCM